MTLNVEVLIIQTFFWSLQNLHETHQQTLVSEEDGVGEGGTRAVVAGGKDGVQTAGSSRHLRQ